MDTWGGGRRGTSGSAPPRAARVGSAILIFRLASEFWIPPQRVMTPAPSVSAEPPSSTARPSGQRVLSVDALRGFDMFWIVGGEWIVEALQKANPNRVTDLLSTQLQHVPWEGFHFYDLIFPLFVFIIGVSLVFSLSRILQEQGRAAAVRRVVRRGVILYLLGILYYGGFSTHLEEIRLLGVLQRLALCYLFAGLAFCFFRTRGLVVTC